MAFLELMRLLHEIGTAWGVGGATIAAIIMAKAEKNQESAPHLVRLMPAISKLMWAAIILLFVSGVALAGTATRTAGPLVSSAKQATVLLLVLNGIVLSAKILPEMKKLAPKAGKPSPEFLRAKRNAKFSGILGLVLWYLITARSVLV